MFADNQPIVPKMPDRTHGTWAETKTEIEARNRAAIAAAEAMQTASEEAAVKQEKTWGNALVAVFVVISIVTTIFAILEYLENNKLRANIEQANYSLESINKSLEELQENYETLKEELLTPSETDEKEKKEEKEEDKEKTEKEEDKEKTEKEDSEKETEEKTEDKSKEETKDSSEKTTNKTETNQ